MSTTVTVYRPAPRYVAIAGIVFAVLFVAGLTAIRLAVPADPTDPGPWLAHPENRARVGFALNLVPLAGIAFLWYMAALRSRIGLLEDRLFGTMFLASGWLFVAMLFASAAVSQGVLSLGEVGPQIGPQVGGGETYRFGRRVAHTLLNVYGVKSAAVFMFVSSSIGLRTGVLARWLSFVGFAAGLALLLVIAEFAWIALVFPFWVLLVSTWVLIKDFRGELPHGSAEPAA